MNRWLHPRKWLSLPLRFHNILFFLAGFLLEALPMVRRDTWASLAIQLAFLSGAAVLLVSRTWERSGVWRPGMVLSWAWSYQEELYYFLYGYLLNAYAIFFLKDRAVIWFLLWAALLVLMLFINEIPRVHWHIHRFRLIFFAFCAAAFSALALSTVHQWPGGGVFVFSLGLSAVLTGGLAVAMSDPGAGRRRRSFDLFSPALVILLALFAADRFGLIPPVPRFVQADGFYHDIEWEPDGYRLKAAERPRYSLWRKDSSPFAARTRDRLFYHARVFSPRQLTQPLRVRWEAYDPALRRYEVKRRAPLTLLDADDWGLGGYDMQTDYFPGLWRVLLEQEDGRVIGMKRLLVKADDGEHERRWTWTALPVRDVRNFGGRAHRQSDFLGAPQNRQR